MNRANEQGRQLSAGLKELHRALLHAEAGDDPAMRESPYTMLFAVIGEDPRFKWMAGLTRLIVDLDERLAAKEPFEPENLAPFVSNARRLLGIEEEADKEFRLRYLIAVQKEPSVGIAAGQLRAVLSELP